MPTDPSLPVDLAEIIALFLGALCYGVFLVSFGVCVRCLLWAKSNSAHGLRPMANVQWNMVAVAIGFFLLLTLHIALVLSNCVEAFIRYKGPGGAVTGFAILTDSSWTYIAQSICLILTICLADAMLIYRCWVVWNRSWRIVVFPIVMWIGVVTTAILGAVIQATSPHRVVLKAMRPYLTAFFCVPLAQNFLTTGLIVYRIHQVDVESRRFDSDGRHVKTALQRVIRIIIESGMLYSAMLIITLGTYISKSNAFFIISIMNDPVIGIAFNLIIIRASSQSAKDEYSFSSDNTMSTRSGTLGTASYALSDIRFKSPQDSYMSSGSYLPSPAR